MFVKDLCRIFSSLSVSCPLFFPSVCLRDYVFITCFFCYEDLVTLALYIITEFDLWFGHPFLCKCNMDQFYLYLSDLDYFSQSSVLHSQPKSTVGTPAYIAPEVLLRQEYDGKVESVRMFIKLLGILHFLARNHGMVSL